ncbi:monocarboxylate transporter 12 [Drosophila rhopaloa]|uniref:Monocarboxylate transporter 12 n=1 Tax=Drosophila rhopaloa TaxID=1041015 RepID=A0A6P4EAS3_DRORH|nr:monocarboxylate transporter 12 [Drosophila rhopaloa]
MATQHTKSQDELTSKGLVSRQPDNIKEENENESEEDIEEAAVVVPPDSGWAWVVMVASFLCCTVIDGIVFCSSMISEPLIEQFGVGRSYVGFVSSLLSGVYLMAGPFVSALANRFGFRPVTIAGAILASICFGLSYFAPSVEYLFIIYGVLGGIGFCMVYIPAVVIIGFYFEKWRALATGVAMCGSGVGTFVFAPLTEMLLKKGWRHTVAIQGLIVLSCAIFGLAFRPIQPITLSATKEEGEEQEKSKLNGHGNTVAPTPQLHQAAFTKPLPEGRFAYSMPNSAHNTYMGASQRHHYPTAQEIFKGMNLERRPSGTPQGSKGTELKQLRKSQPTTPNGDPQQLTFNLHKELTTVGENEEEAENDNLLETEAKPVTIQARRHTVSGRRPQDIGKRPAAGAAHDAHHGQTQSSSRPMYRDDIFFTGSLTRIPQYQSQTSLAYHMSVTRLPTKQDMLEDRQKGCRICPEAVRRTLSTMLDTSLLKSPAFMFLAFSGFLTMMGFFVPFGFLGPRAKAAGMTNPTSLVSGIGIVNTVARIVCGLISSFPAIKPLWLNNIALTAGGLATIFSGVVINAASQWAFVFFFGICIACFSALRSLIAVELIGLEKLTNAYGFLMLFQGVAAIFGSPIAGALYDMTGSYNATFYFAGGLILLSAFLCYPLTCVGRWEQRRNEKLTPLPAA